MRRVVKPLKGFLRPSPGRVSQLVAIAMLCGMGAVILHKAVTDIARLAGLHSGGEFWRRLARYLIANLAG